MDYCAGLVHGKVPGLSAFKVFGFVDGLNLEIQSSGDSGTERLLQRLEVGHLLLAGVGVRCGGTHHLGAIQSPGIVKKKIMIPLKATTALPENIAARRRVIELSHSVVKARQAD
jgi:hypothetical protein